MHRSWSREQGLHGRLVQAAGQDLAGGKLPQGLCPQLGGHADSDGMARLGQPLGQQAALGGAAKEKNFHSLFSYPLGVTIWPPICRVVLAPRRRW